MKLFEMQIPVAPNCSGFIFVTDADGNFTREHHEKFFALVADLCGGYSVLPQIDGFWVGDGKTYSEKMIPVRFAIESDFDSIVALVEFAKRHYDQEAIFVAEIGTAWIY